MNDDLKLAELRSKEVIWNRILVEISQAYNSIPIFLERLEYQEPRLQRDVRKQELVHRYYRALVEEARDAIFVSQNGRYFEFRCMEELLVRHRQFDPRGWRGEVKGFVIPHIDGFSFVNEEMKSKSGSQTATIVAQIREIEMHTDRYG